MTTEETINDGLGEILIAKLENTVLVSLVLIVSCLHTIIESVDSISRDGPDTPIYIIHYKKTKYYIIEQCHVTQCIIELGQSNSKLGVANMSSLP